MTTEKIYGNMKMFLIVLLALNLLFVLYIAFFKKDAYRLETLKVGGSENMKMAIQLYKAEPYIQQQKSALEQYLGSLGQSESDETLDSDTDSAIDTQDTSSAVIDPSILNTILQDGYIKGKKNARITIIEYSDFLCPFCKRHYNDQTIENLIAKYPNDVNMVFRQMPLPQLHPTAPLGAQGAVCVGKLAGSDKFYAYIGQAFQVNEFTQTNVTDIALGLGVNESKFVSCLTSPETIATVNAQVSEGQSFGINGTPGNLVVDTQNGTYRLIAGAYPSATFEAEILKILQD